jgi:hypothetical protein
MNAALGSEWVFGSGMLAVYCSYFVVLSCSLEGIIGEGCIAFLFSEGRLCSIIQSSASSGGHFLGGHHGFGLS